MKLLFDENLSFRLVRLLADEFPGSRHVREAGLQSGSDREVWSYAARNEFAIVSKDDDFHQRSFLAGHPPKVIWIGLGNCSTAKIAAVLRLRRKDLESFERDSKAAFLVLA